MQLLKRLFGSRDKTKQPHASLFYKDAEAFMAAQDAFGVSGIVKNRALFGLIINPREPGDCRPGIKRDEKGIQTAILRLPRHRGKAQIVLAQTMIDGPDLSIGDLVCWMPLEYNARQAQLANDPVLGWVGFITAKIAPEDHAGGPRILTDYRPAKLR